MTRKDLIEKYIKDKLSQEESILLLDYLKAAEAPEDKELYKKIWDACSTKRYFTSAQSEDLLQHTKQRFIRKGENLDQPISDDLKPQ